MNPVFRGIHLLFIINLIIIILHPHINESSVIVEINIVKNGTARGISSETNEAEAIVLDTTENFLPTTSLVSKISKDLGLIRSQFPNMKNISYSGKFTPGQLMVHKITEKQLKEIDGSEFGPLLKYCILKRGSLALLEFKMPYNPYQLGEIIKGRFGVDNSPLVLPSLSNSIAYQPGSPSKYTFKSSTGNCFVKDGCTQWNSWTYSVSENGTISIELKMQSDE